MKSSLTELSIAYNQTQASDSLMTLPAGLFVGLTNLTTLRLEHNDLESLPDRIFEKLTNLTTLTLHGNPGSARFLPVAVAGPEGGIDAKAGEPVKLGGDAGGPWGKNVTYSWRKATGTTVDLSAPNIQEPTVTAPALAEAAALGYELTVTARGTSLTATDSVTVRVAAMAVATVTTEVTLSSRPIVDSTYKSGETIQATVAFSMPVTVTGMPQLALSVGTQTLQATYVQGTGTRRLVFEYMVRSGDADLDGIAIAADSLSLPPGVMIVDANGALADLDHALLVAQTGHKVGGSDDALTGGICERTPQLRDKLVELVRAKPGNSVIANCSLVTTTHLAALTGDLDLGSTGIATLKRGDFLNLGGIGRLILDTNDLTALPADLFEGLGGTLTVLRLDGNDLQTIPAGVFDRLTGLTLLQLSNNDLSSLPPRVFEELTGLLELHLANNPGRARFVPIAKAGLAGGIDVPSGKSVTLGVAGAENGYDDPWGKNVTWAWTLPAGTTVTYDAGKGANTARPSFTAPATDGTLTFTLTVTGTASDGVAATSTVHVRVGATAVAPMPVSAAVDGETLTLTYGEDLQAIDPAPKSDKGPVYLAVVSEPGARRNIETAAPSAVEVTGRQVILTLDPSADFGDTVTLSYYPDNAVAASRVRGLGGILADAFTGLRVDNDTPEGNTIQNFAFTGPAKTYRIGDTIGIEVTFAEAVTVTGAPTLALEIGAARRKAAYVRGSGSAVLTFEYTPVALGEEDTDGIAVAANGLEVPSGSSIVNTGGDREAAILRHGRYHDPAYKVDGVLPTATGAAAAGPTVTVTWSEALDDTSAPTGAGGFTVRIGGTAEPAVRSVEIDGRTVTLALARGIRAEATGVTVDYAPQSATRLQDRAGNAAAGFTGQAVTPREADNNKAAGRVAVSGSATVGQRLTATVSDVADPDGPPSTGYSFTWLRIDGSSETSIRTSTLEPGVTSNAYTLAAADAGKRIGVKVTFEDHVGNDEEFESDVFPDFGRIVWPADAACAMPDLGGRELVWNGRVGVETGTSAYGYAPTIPGSTLSDTTFSFGSTGYTVDDVTVATGGTLSFSTATDLPTTATDGVQLHVCGDPFHFGDGPDAGTGADASYASGTFTYSWTSSGLDWSGHSSRRVYMSKGDTRAPVLTDIVVDGATLTMIYDEKLKRTDPVPNSGGPDPYAVSVSGGNPFTLSDIRAGEESGSNGNQVTMTLDPEAEAGQTIGVTYFENHASAASKAQDLAGNAAAGFLQSPVPVRNVTIDGPGVESVAFAGAAQTYAIGDPIGVDVTFNESVTVTARPRLALEIGSETRHAVWKTGQGAGAVHRFEYTVAEDDLDTDGVAVKANSLETPTGSSIRTSVGNRVVQLAHDAVGTDTARTVDGVRPTATAAVAEGLTIEVTWSEALDAASAGSGAGGFRVRIGNANGPAVTAVAVDGTDATKLRLTLASAIDDGTQDATLEYRPPSSGTKVRDAAGNDAEGFTGSDALAVSVTPDTTAPVLAGKPAVNGTRLTLAFDEPLDEGSVPAAPGGFTVTVTRGGNPVSGHTVTDVAVSGPTVTLTLAQGVLTGDTVTLAYTPTSTPLRDRAVAPNEVAAFSGQTVDNGTDALEVSLSTAEAVEGDDRTVTLTVKVAGGGMSGVARAIGIAPVPTPTAAETEDWTLAAEQRSLTLGAGRRSAAAEITVVDDARLEVAETVSFAVTADGAPIGQVTLTIADDDQAVLAVRGPAQVTEGGVVELTLRLEPHPENVANVSAVADDACIVDFPVTATLTRAGDIATALPSNPTLETDHSFAATSFDDCTREVTVSVQTKDSDGEWMADRALTFALVPQADSDPRVEAGEALSTVVRYDTPPPGPMVTDIAVSPLPAEASEEHSGPYTKEAFLALPDEAVHGRGTTLTFTLTFDSAVTVTPDADTQALPELVLDVFGRKRRARYTGGSGTNVLTFTWTVAKGDNDPDGIRIESIDPRGGTIRFAAGCTDNLPCDMDVPTFKSDHAQRYPKHRVRGGLHAMRFVVSEYDAREGEPFTVTVQRDGGFDELAHAIVRMTDSGVEKLTDDLSNLTPEELQELRDYAPRLLSFPFDEASREQADPKVSVQTVTPPGDGEANDERTLTFELIVTDVGDGEGGHSYWYETRAPVEVTVPVTDTGLAGGAPDSPSLGVWDDWTQEPTQEQWDRGTRFPLRFDVTVPWPNVLRPRGDGKVTVQYETRNGTAVADSDYVATSGTLTFEAGETRKTVEVEVMADRHDEGEETLTLVLSNATGALIVQAEATGTIRNNGLIPKVWIARFGRTVAEQMLEAVEGRMRAAPAPGVEITLAGEQIGGQPPDRGPGQAGPGSEAEREAWREEETRRDAQRLTDWLNSETDDQAAQHQSRAVTPRDLLTGSSFTLTEETPGKDMVSFWGRGAVTSFDGREGDLTLDGEVATGMLGADWSRGRWTTGLILSHSSAEGGYSGAPGAGDGSGSGAVTGGKVEATLTGLFPWTRHALSERLEAWGVAGYGAGELTVTPKKPGTDEDGAVIRADLDLRMAVVGLRGTLLDGGGDGLTLTGKTDAMVVQTASGQGRGTDGGNLEPARATVTRLRLGVEASRPVGFDGGATLTPSLEVGLRHDGGDAETGFGLDLGIGLALGDPERGLQAELRGRGLLAHESSGFRDLGFSGSLAWEGKPGSDRGAKLGLTQTVGGSSSGGADALLSRTTLDGLAANDPGSGSGAGDNEGGNDELKSRRLELRFGYGLPAFGGRFTWTPEAYIGLSDTGRDYSLGWRLVRGGSGDGGGSFEISFEARRSESVNDDTQPVHEVGFRFVARF